MHILSAAATIFEWMETEIFLLVKEKDSDRYC